MGSDVLYQVENSGYRVDVIANSSPGLPGVPQLTTLVARYPRFVHSQFLTHRCFSRNSSSNRAMGFKRCVQEVMDDPAIPIAWEADKRGMTGGDALPGDAVEQSITGWRQASESACHHARKLHALGVHHQVVNRILEPYQWMTTIITGTRSGWESLWKLRCDDAQPEIQRFARMTKEGVTNAPYSDITHGGWHLPFAPDWGSANLHDVAERFSSEYTWTELSLFASAGRCARISYLRHDRDSDSAQAIIEDVELSLRLMKDGHWSPFEHQARPWRMTDRDNSVRNLNGWIQFRRDMEYKNGTR